MQISKVQIVEIWEEKDATRALATKWDAEMLVSIVQEPTQNFDIAYHHNHESVWLENDNTEADLRHIGTTV